MALVVFWEPCFLFSFLFPNMQPKCGYPPRLDALLTRSHVWRRRNCSPRCEMTHEGAEENKLKCRWPMLRQIARLATCRGPRRLRKWRSLHSRQRMWAMFCFFSPLFFILGNSCSVNQSNLCPELKPPVARDEKRDPPEEARRLDRFL